MTLCTVPSGALSPIVWGDGVNDDLRFCARKPSDWSKRSLSIRQACQGTTNWTRSQILGRSLEYATSLSKHFTISIQTLYQTHPPPFPFSFHEADILLHLRLRNRVTARNHNYQDSWPLQEYPSICTTLLGLGEPRRCRLLLLTCL